MGHNPTSVPLSNLSGGYLDFSGISLNPISNKKYALLISNDGSCVSVRVIYTNEEIVIARSICRLPS